MPREAVALWRHLDTEGNGLRTCDLRGGWRVLPTTKRLHHLKERFPVLIILLMGVLH